MCIDIYGSNVLWAEQVVIPVTNAFKHYQFDSMQHQLPKSGYRDIPTNKLG